MGDLLLQDEVYLPSPEEIREQCQKFQLQWTDSERIARVDLLPWQLNEIKQYRRKPYEFPAAIAELNIGYDT